MTQDVVIAGGGIGGLACALALTLTGQPVRVLEQADRLAEVGAGIQLGPNAVRVLDAWGLSQKLADCAVFPQALQVRDAHAGTTLGRLALGAAIRARYGQPYATVHRADLQCLLLEALSTQTLMEVSLGSRVVAYAEAPHGVTVTCEDGRRVGGAALVGADGLWSRVRAQLLGPQPVRASGHLAYRGVARPDDLPPSLREPMVTAWLGPRLHVVHYPVRRGELVNVVAVVEGRIGHGHGGNPDDPQSWTHEAHAADLARALGQVHGDLKTMIDAVRDWKLWPLNDRRPMAGPGEQARGRVALLGDAAHPLRPYLAQGAAMAIEDAWTLGRLRAEAGLADDWPTLFARYARTRWARNAQVQARSERNGRIFHATGLVRWGRNLAMAMLGESLLDQPWLYRGPPVPQA
jgi:salicylate hydroxylase